MPGALACTRRQLIEDLVRLGVRAGDLLMVHSSVRSVGPMAGGVNELVQALFAAIGPQGTLAAYIDFEPFFDEDDPALMPVFDKRIAQAARDHGILHETLRNWPGALRSDHPDAGVAAIGPLAPWITADHPFEYGYGPGSPLEKILQAQGRVLMLGAPLDTITLLHYAEHQANLPGKRVVRYRRLMPGASGPGWIDFEEFDTGDPVCDGLAQNCFQQIALAHLAAGHGRRGQVGQADSYLFEASELVPFAIEWLEKTVG